MQVTSFNQVFNLTRNDEGVPQVALIIDSLEITNPLVCPSGDFAVDPRIDYGISDTLAYLIAKLNQQLRNEAVDRNARIDRAEELEALHPEPSQHKYVRLGFGACPQCGSQTLAHGEVEMVGRSAYEDVRCQACGARWNNLYTLTGFEIVEDGSVRGVRAIRLQAQLKKIDQRIENAKSLSEKLGSGFPVSGADGPITVATYLVQLQAERDACAKAIADIEHAAPCDEYFAEMVIGNAPERFDAIALHGTRLVDYDETGRRLIEVDDLDPQFWSLYLRQIEGGVVCIADLSTRAKAEQYAVSLSAKYGFRFDDSV